MPHYDIEQWEKETAEVEIRRWLSQIGQWESDLELARLQTREGADSPFGTLSSEEIDRACTPNSLVASVAMLKGKLMSYRSPTPMMVPISMVTPARG